MDAKSVVTTILSDESVNSISKKTGASTKDISSVLSAALPLLLAGANDQAQNQSTAEGFTNALVQHSAADTSNVGSFLSNVDMSDGAKIIAHLLGVNTQTQTIAQQSGVSAADTGNILAVAAPLLMSLLGQQTQVQSNSSASAVSGLMGNLLGSLLGGGSQPQSNQGSSGIDLGDIVSLLGKLLK